MKWLILALGLIVTSASAQTVVGPLQAQKNLSEIAKNGASAQSAARTNLGVGSVAGPYLPLAGGTVAGLLTTTGGLAGNLTVPSTKSVAINNSLTFTGTDSTSFAFPSTSDTVAALGQAQTFTANNNFKSIDNVLYCDQFASISACHTALPSTGGKMILPPNTTIQTALTGTSGRITITKPNVIVECPSWNTILKRGTSQTGQILLATSAATNFTIRDCTFDGNGAVNATGTFDLEVDAANGLVDHVQAINSGGQGGVIMAGAGGRVTGSTVVGLGSSSLGGYGIWAINHVQVTIDHNIVHDTYIDGIGADGNQTMISDNYVYASQWKASVGGGQIAVYPGFSGIILANNTVGAGGSGSLLSHGYELNGGVTVTGGTILSQAAAGMTIHTGPVTISGLHIKNSGQHASGIKAAAILIDPSVSGVRISGGSLVDDQGGSATQNYAFVLDPGTAAASFTGNIAGTTLSVSGVTGVIAIGQNVIATGVAPNTVITGGSGASWTVNIPQTVGSEAMASYAAVTADDLIISDVDMTGNISNPPVYLPAIGTHVLIKNNVGVDTVVPSAVTAAATLNLPLNPIAKLTGTTAVTYFAPICFTGRVIEMISDGATPFTAGNNIANSITMSANVPSYATCDGTNWYFR